MSFYMMFTQSAKKTNGSRGRVELGKLVLFDGLPVARGGGIDRGRFEDYRRDPISEWPIDDVSISK